MHPRHPPSIQTNFIESRTSLQTTRRNLLLITLAMKLWSQSWWSYSIKGKIWRLHFCFHHLQRLWKMYVCYSLCSSHCHSTFPAREHHSGTWACGWRGWRVWTRSSGVRDSRAKGTFQWPFCISTNSRFCCQKSLNRTNTLLAKQLCIKYPIGNNPQFHLQVWANQLVSICTVFFSVIDAVLSRL